jgi:protein-disulfide isomerase
MKLSQRGACLVGLSLAIVLAVPAAAQQTTTDDLKKEIDSLRTMLQGIQKDLQELKGMMARQTPPPSGIGAVIDFGNSPIKGERTAKLTLVEFSDYQ